MNSYSSPIPYPHLNPNPTWVGRIRPLRPATNPRRPQQSAARRGRTRPTTSIHFITTPNPPPPITNRQPFDSALRTPHSALAIGIRHSSFVIRHSLPLPFLALICLLLTLSLPAAQPATWSTGITEPIWDILLSAPVAGTISTNHFKEGDFVRQGQVIQELDKKLEELTVTRRKLVADTLKNDLEGTRKLFDTTKSVSKDDLDKKELEYKVAMVDYDTAGEQLRRRQLIAPMDGFVTDLIFDPGEDCKPQDPMIRLVDTRRGYLVTHVDAKFSTSFRVGQKVPLEIESGSASLAVEGQISFVSPVVDPASGLLKIKAIFDNANGKIRPGVAGKLQLPSLSNAQ